MTDSDLINAMPINNGGGGDGGGGTTGTGTGSGGGTDPGNAEPAAPAINAPASGSTLDGNQLNGQITVTGVVDVGNWRIDPASAVTVRISGGSSGTAVKTGDYVGGFSWTFVGDIYRSGSVLIQATVSGTDAKGNPASNQATSRITVTDTVPPSVGVDAPASGSVLHVSETGMAVPVRATVTDALGVDSVTVTLGATITNLNRPGGAIFGSGTWEGVIVCDPVPLGVRTLQFNAVDHAGNPSPPVNVAITVVDGQAPSLRVTSPADGARLLMVAGGSAKLSVAVSCGDRQSGLDRIECWLTDSAGNPLTTSSTDGPLYGHRQFSPPSFVGEDSQCELSCDKTGFYGVKVCATDLQGNVATQFVRGVEVADVLRPIDANDLLGLGQYLHDLREFALSHIREYADQTPGRLLSDDVVGGQDILVRSFGQDFRALSSDRSAWAWQAVNQARICAEILRAQADFVSVGVPQDYLMAAYLAVLAQLGIGFDELRRLRMADVATQGKFVQRLGFNDDPPGAKIGRMLIDVGGTADDLARQAQQLQQVFGVVDSGSASAHSAVTLDHVEVYNWQVEGLSQRWLRDDAMQLALVVDPDIVARGEILDARAAELWLQRRALLDGIRMQLAQAWKPDGSALTTMLELAYGLPAQAPSMLARIDAVVQSADTGGRLEPGRLAALWLDLSSARQIVRFASIIAAGAALLDAEVAELVSILTGIWKASRYEAWRDEEVNLPTGGIALSPMLFRPLTASRPLLPKTGYVDGTQVALGQPCPAWTVQQPADPAGQASYPAAVASRAHPYWLPNDDESVWLTCSPTGNGADNLSPGTYIYRTTFNLDGWDLSSLDLSVRVAADDGVAMRIGPAGGPMVNAFGGQSFGGFARFTTLAVEGELLSPRTNCLEFLVNNADFGSNPTGLRVEFILNSPARRKQASRWQCLAPAILELDPPTCSTGAGSGALKSNDLFWRVTSAPAGVSVGPAKICTGVPEGWVGDGTLPDGARWIAPFDDLGVGSIPAGDYRYECVLDLTGWSLASAALQLHVAAGNPLKALTISNAGGSNSVPLPAGIGASRPTTIPLDAASGAGLVAGPNTLVLIVAVEPGAGATGLRVALEYLTRPRLFSWVRSSSARIDWESTLEARARQLDDLQASYADALQRVELLTLPLLRDGLISAWARANRLSPAEAAQTLGQRLMIETQGDAWRLTTRVAQAIESLQTLVQGVREERYSGITGHPAQSWRIADQKQNGDPIDQDTFDEEWTWMGRYEAWRPAMLVYYFPENLLLPSLRPDEARTSPFNALVKALRARSTVGRDYVLQCASQYLSDINSHPTVGQWRCNEGQGTTIGDSGPNQVKGEIHSTLDGGAVWKAGPPNLGDQSAAIDIGDKTWLSIPANDALALLAGTDFTLALRIKPASSSTAGGPRRILQMGSLLDRQNVIFVGQGASGVVGVTLYTSVGELSISTAPLAYDQWWHVALVRSGKSLLIYWSLPDGTGGSASTEWSIGDADFATGFAVGGAEAGTTSLWFGLVCDIRLDRHAIPESMVRQIARTGGLLPAAVSDTISLNVLRSDAELGRLRDQSRLVWPQYKGDAWTNSVMSELWYHVPMSIALQLQKSGDYTAALDWYRSVYAYQFVDENARKIFPGLADESNRAPVISRDTHWLSETALNPHLIAAARNFNPLTRYTLLNIVRCLIEYADAEFTADSGASLANARELYDEAARLLRSDELVQLQPTGPDDPPLLPNPVLWSLRRRYEVQLNKLRRGRNIAGMPRSIDPPEAPSTITGLPVLAGSGQLIVSRGGATQRPTAYRYQTLLDRARQLVAIAQQMEGNYLSALEKLDQENYNLKKAGYDLKLASAGLELQNRRVKAANDQKTVADKQKDRAQVQHDRYQKWLDDGQNVFEIAVLIEKGIELAAGIVALVANAVLETAQAQLVEVAVAAPAATTKAIAQGVAAGAENAAQINSIRAGWQRRSDEWTLARDLSDKDIQIADAQINEAQDQIDVASQEQAIASIQNDQARDLANFLATKFTNAELYEWMSGVLGSVYSYFLQQATAVATMAQNQLAFERQENPGAVIQGDYWTAPLDSSASGVGTGQQDRRGLTGSARLLQDIYQLDQFSFENDRRKLNLSQTFSLATLFPQEFSELRLTGHMSFRTLLGQFDEAFPGHYLRLIRHVRVAVAALIPPTTGIRASLTASGVSKVVIGGDVFSEVEVRRDPETIAFSSPLNGTGVFDLDPQPELLQPFESMGVETTWSFSIPRAANAFDFDTLIDVLLTIDYTALYSQEYQDQLILQLPDTTSASRAFSLRRDFPDVWYGLVNAPDNPATTGVVFSMSTTPADFPPHVQDLKISDVLLAPIPDDTALPNEWDGEIVGMSYMPQPPAFANSAGDEVEAGIVDGRISTLTTAKAWASTISGKPAAGRWRFTISSRLQQAVASGAITDFLMIETFSARRPRW